MEGTLRLPAASAAFVVLALSTTAQATTHTVTIGGTSGHVFTQSEITILVGDTVRWEWDGGLHDVESGVGGIHDGNFDYGAATTDTSTTFEVTFDQSFLDANSMPNDEYPYYCEVHWALGMTGKVIVQQLTVPAVSDWGLAVMTLLILTAGSVLCRRRVTGLPASR